MLKQEIETQLIRRLTDDLKYVYRPDIRDLAALEANFTPASLNISRYISTAEPEADVNLAAVHRNLEELDARIAAATARHNAFLRELGLPEIG